MTSTRISYGTLLLKYFLLPLLPFLLAADWPGHLGPTRDGQSNETKLTWDWPKDGPAVAWKIPVRIDRLPALAAAASVLVMPYIDAPVTRAMQPLKLKEYLATGRPCVVRDLGATRVWADALDLAATPGEFAAAVLLRLAGDTPLSQLDARRRLASESWAAKARQFRTWVDA